MQPHNVPALQAAALSALRAVIDPAQPCALLGFHDYSNVGDHAIWLGQRSLLRRLGCRIAYAASAGTFSAVALRERLPAGTILFQGGGNFGDLWGLQPFRERMIVEFPRHRFIQLPQSICFLDRRNLARCKEIVERHPDLHLMVRDRQSLEFAQRHFDVAMSLCPDLAVGLDEHHGRPADPARVLWLCRDDRELAEPLSVSLGPRERVSDWAAGPANRAGAYALALRRRVGAAVLRRANADRVLRIFDAVAARRLRQGWHMLDGAGVVVSNRLHGHLLCVLAGKDHVILPDRYGKLVSFFETWTKGIGKGRVAGSVAEAQKMALALGDRREQSALPSGG